MNRWGSSPTVVFRFWSETGLQFPVFINSFRENLRVLVLGDLNAKEENESVAGVTGKYGVPGRDDSGDELTGLGIKMEFLVGIIWFKKDMNNYTWERVRRVIVMDRH